MNGFAIVIASFVAIAAGIIVYTVLRQHRRIKALETFAVQNGYRYQRRDPGLAVRLDGIYPMNQGKRHTFEHVITGAKHRVAFATFEWHCRIGNEYIQMYAIVVQVPPAPARLNIEPETLKHKMLELVGVEEIDFESAKFSQRYWVTCAHRKFAYDVLDPRMISWLLGRPLGRWQWSKRSLTIIRQGILTAKTAEGLINSGVKFAHMIPRHVRQRLGDPPIPSQ